jgi:anti-sigma factor RsiW
MNRAALENLIIDRRLGELPDDVEQLLDAYLLASPDAVSSVQEVESTLSMTKRALKASATDDMTLPSFPSSRVATALAGRSLQSSRFLRWPVALAATLALGVFLGTRTNSPTTQRPSHSIPVVFSGIGDEAPSDFWSLSPRQSRSKYSSTATSHVEWTSPLNWPVKGESL